jgi:hypothetical protein
VGGVGISINNVVHIHLLDSEWNPSSNYQAESRAIRVTSHEDLLEESETGKVTVKIYNHAAYTCDTTEKEKTKKKGKGRRKASSSSSSSSSSSNASERCTKKHPMISVDVRIQIVIEEKDRNIKRVERFLKRIAVDCQSHFERNKANISAEDGTKECDYTVCDRPCYDPKPLKTDFSTFDVYYMDEPIRHLMDVLRSTLQTNNGFLYAEDLLRLAKAQDPKRYDYLNEKYITYLGLALLESPQTMLNRFGILSYIRKEGNLFFLTNVPVTALTLRETSVCQSMYNQSYVAQDIRRLETVIDRGLVQQNISGVLEVLDLLDPSSQEYELFIHSTKVALLSAMLEEVLLIPPSSRSKAQQTFIQRMSLYTHDKLSKRFNAQLLPHIAMWYTIPEPKRMIDTIQLRLDVKEGKISNIKSKAGRPPLDGIYHPDVVEYDPREVHDFGINRGEEAYDWGGGKEKVLFHILDSAVLSSDLNYKSTAQFNNISGKIRIYKPSEGKWRDASEVEQVAYSLWAQKQLYAFKEYYESFPVYGFLFPSDPPLFMIRTKYKDPPGGKGGKRDKFRGQRCKTISVPDLAEIFMVSEVAIPLDAQDDFKRLQTQTPEDIRKRLFSSAMKVSSKIQDTWKTKSTDEQRRLLFWLTYIKSQKGQKEFACRTLQSHFQKIRAIYQTY